MDRKKWIIIGGICALVLVLGSSFLTYSLSQKKEDEEGICNTEDCAEEENKNNDEEVDVSNMADNTVELALIEDEKTGTYNNEDYVIQLYRLDSKSTIVKEINTKIQEEYNNIKEDNTEDAVYRTTCLLKQNGTIVSFLVRHMGMIPSTSFISNKYFVYLFDLETNKMLSNTDLYTLFNTTESEVLTKLKSSLTDQDNLENIKIDQAYINENDKLSVIYKRVLDGNVFYYVYDVV